MENTPTHLKDQEPLVPSYYYEKLAKASQELYADYFSDLTRKRQGYLLLCSVISILIAYAVIEPTGGSFFIDFIIPSNLAASKFVASLLCAYFLIIYLGGYSQDRRAYDLKIQPTFIELSGLAITISDKIYKIEQGYRKHFDEKVRETLQEAFKNYAQNQTNANGHKLSQAIAKFQRLQTNSNDELEGLYAKYEELSYKKTWEAFIELTEIANRIRNIYADIWKKERDYLKIFLQDMILPVDLETENRADRERMDYVIEKIKEYKFFRNLKVTIEILFPIGLAIYAIVANLVGLL